MSGYHLLAWSGGKDSALALQAALFDPGRPIKLFTTITGDYGRVTMHGVRAGLLRAQAEALGLALEIVEIPKDCSAADYEAIMAKALMEHRSRGCQGVIFGDIFLADVRRYREANLAQAGMPALFPLWGRDTGVLARRFIARGFQAVVTCADGKVLDRSFAGRAYDADFLRDLPAGADPCGENGEFHTFVWDGPVFNRPVAFRRGEVVLREERFHYCDLLPLEEPRR